MKPQLNEYYQCSSSGYIKYQNVPVSHLPIIRQIPVTSRCNEILPYKLHKIQVQHPTNLPSPRQSIQQITIPTLQLPSKDLKRQAPLYYSFSASLMQNPSKILQKDEVHSIHLDQNINSTKINTVQNSNDLTKSTYTTSRKHSPEMKDMKRSLFSTNNSVLTHYTISKQKYNQKIQLIASQVKRQREKREEFEKKYEILFNLVNRTEEPQQTITVKEPSQNEQTFVENHEKQSRKNKKKSHKKKNYVRSNTESSQQSQQQRSILKTSHKGHRKGLSHSPIVINIGSQVLQKEPKHTNLKTFTSQQNEEYPHIIQMKQGLHEIKREVDILHENVQYLQKKLDEQEMRHQKDMLMQELKDKQRKIEEVVKQNQKMKEINELLINKRVEPLQKEQFSIFGLNLEKNSMGASFLISFLVILLVLNLKSAIC